MPERIAYKFRLEPTAEQKRQFDVFAGHSRFVYNELLSRSEEAYANGKAFPINRGAFCKLITSMRREFAWLQDAHSQSLQVAADDLIRAYNDFFNPQSKSLKPKFKSRKNFKKSFGYKQKVRIDGTHVFLPKIGWIKFRKSREPVGVVKSARVIQSASGHWYVTLNCEREFPKMPPTDSIIGVDVGLKTYTTVWDGEKCQKEESPKPLRRSLRKLAKLQRSLKRKKKGSANRRKAKLKLACLHERVSNQRKDFQQKLSTKLVYENQVIGVEDLAVKGMIEARRDDFGGRLKTRTARAFADAGLKDFLRQLDYKCKWYGRTLRKADQYYPSTKKCHCCGEKHTSKLPPKIREWTCLKCGVTHDRDENAAINLRNAAVGHTEA